MDTLTITLLLISGIGLLMSLLSLTGLDLDAIDIHLGDSGVGLLSLLAPGVTVGTGVAGLTLAFGVAGPITALLLGSASLLATAALMYPILKALLAAGQETTPTELAGHQVNIIEPVERGSVGFAEAITTNGSLSVTVMLDPEYTGPALLPGQIGYLTHRPDPQTDQWYITTFPGTDQRR